MQAEECVPEHNASVYFISPQDNYVSKSSEVKIVFGIKNFDILPAGIIGCNSGHHHLVTVSYTHLTLPTTPYV